MAYMAALTEEMRHSVYNTPEDELLDFNDIVPEAVNKFRCFYLGGSGQTCRNSFTDGNFHGFMLAGARTSMNYLFQIFFDYYSGVHMRVSSAGKWGAWKKL